MRPRRGIAALVIVGLIVVPALAASADGGDMIPTYGASSGYTRAEVNATGGFGSERDSQRRLVMVSGDSSTLNATRLDHWGYIDTAFSGDGTASITRSPLSTGHDAVAIDSQDRVILATSTFDVGAGADLGLVQRFTVVGNPDTSFGPSGLREIPQLPHIEAVETDYSNRVLIAGYGADGFDVARLSSAGVLDPAFGGDGLASADFGAGARAYAVTWDVFQDQVIVGGTGGGATWGPLAVARFNADGSPDTTFGDNGMAVITTPGLVGAVQAVDVDSVGRIVAAGWLSTCPDGDTCPTYSMVWALARFNTNGSPDTTFGGDGLVTIDPAGVQSPQKLTDVDVDYVGTVYFTGSSQAQGVSLLGAVRNDGAPVLGADGWISDAVNGTTAVANSLDAETWERILVSGVVTDGSTVPYTAAYEPVDGPDPGVHIDKPKAVVKRLSGTTGPAWAGVVNTGFVLMWPSKGLVRKGKCRWLTGPGPTFTIVDRPEDGCDPEPYLLKPKGTLTWHYALGGKLRPGHYWAYASVNLLFGAGSTRSREFDVE